MAALAAVRHNPAVRPLYARVVAKHPDQKAIAIGHAMRKLLHLAFAIWKTKKPFDRNFYPWDTPAHIAPKNGHAPTVVQDQAAGSQRIGKADLEKRSPRPVRAAYHTTPSLARTPSSISAHAQGAHWPIARVLEHLNLTRKLHGRRLACKAMRLPHPSPGQPWPHLQREPGRQRLPLLQPAQLPTQKGDVIDLWAALHHQDLRQAALDLVHTFALEPAPTKPAEKRKG